MFDFHRWLRFFEVSIYAELINTCDPLVAWILEYAPGFDREVVESTTATR